MTRPGILLSGPRPRMRVKFIRYSAPDGSERFGVYSDRGIRDLSPSHAGFAEMISDAHALGAACPKNDFSKADLASFLPPVDRRSKILCMAVNYHSHVREMQTEPTKEPILFSKYYASLTGPYAQIPLMGISPIMDYEGEVAIVIGATARNVKREDAWNFVAGYTLLNDISARSLFRVQQGQHTMLDWFSCKAIDHSTPVGPWIVTNDEAGEFTKLRIETFLNGVPVQSESTSDMIFDVPRIIEFVSSRVTLEPSDIISTGTPAGVGVARRRTLAKGDVVKVQAQGVGYLENRVV